MSNKVPKKNPKPPVEPSPDAVDTTEEPESKYVAGRLTLLDLSKNERSNLLSYHARIKKNGDFDFLSDALPGPELFRFLDLFAGETIKVPPREEILREIECIQIYTYIAARVPSGTVGDDIREEVVSSASVNFDRRKIFCRSAYERVRKTLLEARTDV